MDPTTQTNQKIEFDTSPEDGGQKKALLFPSSTREGCEKKIGGTESSHAV